jgi:hypothetical protein
MKRIVLMGLIVTGISFADSMHLQPQVPVQSSSSVQQPMSSQQQTSPTVQTPTSLQSNSMPSNSISLMLPVEIKPEDKAIINLKKKMVIRQTYNDYQKVDKATNIDRLNLERSLREARYALKVQVYKEKQLDSQLSYPYYYSIPIAGVVGNVVLTSQTPLKDGVVLRGKDRISIKDGLVYVGDYLISYPVMDSIRQPKVDMDAISSSAPQLLTGLPTLSPSNGISSLSGSLPPMALPPPPPPSK